MIFPKTQVIYIWFMAGVSIIIAAILWFAFDLAIAPIFYYLSNTYPTYMNDPGIVFLNAVWTYLPPICLFVIGYLCIVQAQKPPQ